MQDQGGNVINTQGGTCKAVRAHAHVRTHIPATSCAGFAHMRTPTSELEDKQRRQVRQRRCWFCTPGCLDGSRCGNAEAAPSTRGAHSCQAKHRGGGCPSPACPLADVRPCTSLARGVVHNGAPARALYGHSHAGPLIVAAGQAGWHKGASSLSAATFARCREGGPLRQPCTAASFDNEGSSAKRAGRHLFHMVCV